MDLLVWHAHELFSILLHSPLHSKLDEYIQGLLLPVFSSFTLVFLSFYHLHSFVITHCRSEKDKSAFLAVRFPLLLEMVYISLLRL